MTLKNRRSRPFKLDDVLTNYIPQNFTATLDGKTPDMFGVEIELEGLNVITKDPDINKLWLQHNDGSLRKNPKFEHSQTIEYVFQGPYDLNRTGTALKMLMKYLNSEKVTVFESYRTSIHVHINCMNDNFRTIVNFITLAMIFDELFVSQNGQTRIGNNFCLRTRDAEGQLAELINSVTIHGTPFSGISQNNRYSSVNFGSLAKFGTVEFRSLECTTDFDRVMHWIKTIQALKEAARKYVNPTEIIGMFSKKGPLGFMTYNLGDCASKYLAVPEYHEMLNTGMRLAQDFAYCSEWVVPNKTEEKEAKPKGRRLPLKMFNYAEMYNNQILGGPAPAIHDEGLVHNPLLAGWLNEDNMPAQAPWEAAPAPVFPVYHLPGDPAVPDDDDDDDNDFDYIGNDDDDDNEP